MTWQETFDYWAPQLPGTYVVHDSGHWGATIVPPGDLVHIARYTPLAWLPSIMLHESMHVRQFYVWGLDPEVWHTALAPYGGIEIVADCGARLLGATKLSYVKDGVCTSEQNRAANAIIAGVAP